MAENDDSSYKLDDAMAAQYWRELSSGLDYYPQFEGVDGPIDVLSKINEVVSEAESLKKKDGMFNNLMKEKDKKITKLQKRNESLSDMLSEEMNHRRTAKDSGQSSSGEDPEPKPNDQEPKELEDIKKKYQLLLDQKENIYGHWKSVLNDRDEFKDKYQALYARNEELQQQLAVMEIGQPNNIHTTPVKGDKDVVLKRDANGKCGIRFGYLRKMPLLIESNIVVRDIRPGVARASDIRFGDFVIEVNHINVQHLNFEEFQEALLNTDGDLVLKLRSPNREQLQRTVNGYKSLDEWGLTFGVYVKHVKNGMYASNKGINEMDELLKVNSHDIEDILSKHIYKAMNKEVKLVFNHLQNPSDLYETFSSRSSVASGASSFSSHPSPKLNNTIIHVPPTPPGGSKPPLMRDSSRSSMASGTSSFTGLPSPKLNNTNSLQPPTPSGGSEDHLVRDDVSVSSNGSSKQNSSAEDVTLRRGRPLNDSQILHVNNSLMDLSGQLSGGSSVTDQQSSGDDAESRSDVMMCNVKKNDYESFGWALIGGNKVGIYVKTVDNWSPIEKAGIGVGWKVLNIDGTSLENIGFSFVLDFLSSLRLQTSITVKIEKVSREIYSTQISRRPYDNFHIRALSDYKKKSSEESSFKAGEIFCVTDSIHMDVNGVLKWVAKSTSTGQSVIIPSQRARLIFELEESGSRRKSKHIPVRYYEILDPVDVRLLIEEEEEGAF